MRDPMPLAERDSPLITSRGDLGWSRWQEKNGSPCLSQIQVTPTMNFQAILSRLCPCRHRCRRGTQAEPTDVSGTVTEDIVWNCAPDAEPHLAPTLLEQVQVQLEALPPQKPKTFKNVVEHMVEVRDRLMKEVIDYATNPTQLWISYQGAVNTLHWVFSADMDKTWDETIDGPAFDAIIEPLDEDYYEKQVYPVWRWREVKLKPVDAGSV